MKRTLLLLTILVLGGALAGCREDGGTVKMTDADKEKSANMQKEGGRAAPMPTEGVDN
ncbi:MAG: hypothetical protein KIS66_04325 [Fimbriimonadaceae bacterium]|nr:hypothetical protein [Fimbriimonadaceae bacterium]